ncbi:MAG: hypothetical protein HY902_09305, partial [Deltaproteobacteria bacterium]|nr:hypothetical protein [Deltaproteobacteria bacterium]
MKHWIWAAVLWVVAGCGSGEESAKTSTADVADSKGDSTTAGDTSDAADTASPPTPTGAWASVATSDSHSCGVTSLGWVACWGGNADGQLGDGTTQPRTKPVFVGGMDKIASVRTSPGNTCALGVDGGLWCWGHAMATLGVEDPTRPVGLLPPKPIQSVAMSDYTACGLFDDGSVACTFQSFVGGIKWLTLNGVKGAKAIGIGTDLYWLNQDGKLQVGGFDNAEPPVQVSAQPLLELRVAGAQVVGLDAKGQVWVLGEHGLHPPPAGCDASTCDKLTALPGATEVVALSPSCGMKADGSLVCWRYLPQSWQGGNAAKAASAAGVAGVTGATQIDSGRATFAAVNGAGELRFWGHHGGASPASQWQPGPVAGAAGAGILLGGSGGYCALDGGGKPTCWGLRPADSASLPAFLDVASAYNGLPGATKLGFHTAALCGVGSDSKVVCQGSAAPADAGLKIPDRNCQDQPCSVPEAGDGITDIRAAATGGSRWCAVDAGGTLRCWGDPAGHVADLGTGSTATETVWPPVSNPALPPVQTTCFTGGFGCALTTTGQVWCWGERAGWGSKDNAPSQVAGVSGAVELRCHLNAACVVTSAGAVQCWGAHMGKSDVEPRPTTTVADLAPVQTMAMGGSAEGEHYCAIAKGGQVWCWGQGEEGQLGLGAKV